MADGPWHSSLIGLPWPLAREILLQRAEPFRTEETQPPGHSVIEGELRVVQERQETGELVVVLAHYCPRSGQEAWKSGAR